MKIKKQRLIGVLLASLSLAACQQKSKSNLVLQSNQSNLEAMEALMHNMQKCWFKSNSAFSPYLLAPELRSYSDKPRLLLVYAKNPSERPVLVVEANGKDAKIMAYGPLMNSHLGNKIAQDLNFWTNGKDICQK